jgi:hypothetical protein
MSFKYSVGQKVKIISQDRKLSGKTVTISSQHTHSWSGDKKDSFYNQPWYKVTTDWIVGYFSFYESQLESDK